MGQKLLKQISERGKLSASIAKATN